jgi:pyruvate/2-oxoacid:ferredoxin oxidoreductase alpha subunit
MLKTAVEKLREENIPVGLLRPKTLFPFPTNKIKELLPRVEKFLVVEMSNGQMLVDVKLAVEGAKPVQFYNRMGGVVPSTDEIIEQVRKQLINGERG